MSLIPENELLPLAIVFVVFFAIIFFLLKRTLFSENRAISAIIAGGIALLIVYYSQSYINYAEFSMMDSFNFSGGFSLTESVPTILFILVLGVVVFMLFSAMFKKSSKLEFPGVLFSIAALLILLGLAPEIFSIYYLPDWILNYQTLYIVTGIIIAIFAFTRIKKKSGGIRIVTS